MSSKENSIFPLHFVCRECCDTKVLVINMSASKHNIFPPPRCIGAQETQRHTSVHQIHVNHCFSTTSIFIDGMNHYMKNSIVSIFYLNNSFQHTSYLTNGVQNNVKILLLETDWSINLLNNHANCQVSNLRIPYYENRKIQISEVPGLKLRNSV